MFSIQVDGAEVFSSENEDQAWERFDTERARARFDRSSEVERIELHGDDGKELASWTCPQWIEEDPSILEALESGKCGGDLFSIESDWSEDREDFEDGGSVSFSTLGQSVSGKDLRARVLRGELIVLVPEACSGSDYNGGALARSNAKALRELAESEALTCFELHGGHGSHGVAFPLWIRSAELVSILEGLQSYPVVDEDAMSEEEREDEDQAWESYVRSDFARALESETGIDVSEVKDEDLRSFFFDRCSALGRYFEHSDEGAWIDVEELADGLDRSEVLELPGAVSATADEEARAERILGAFGVKIADHGGDHFPALEEWERIELQLRPLGLFDRTSDPLSSVLSMLRQVAQWPLAADFESLRKQVETVRDRAREYVLPMLERSGRYGADELAKEWGRHPESGLELREHAERELGEAWARYARARDPKRNRSRTFVLPTETSSRLLALGLSAEDAVRSYVLDRIAEELRSRMGPGIGHGVLAGSHGGWEDVLEVDRATELVRTRPKDGSPDRERKLGDFESLFHP